MTAQRFLSSAWASVHGPHDPHKLLVWALEAQFGGLVAGPGPRVIDWAAVRAAQRGLPVSFPAVRMRSPLAPLADCGLAASADRERNHARAAVAAAAAIASTLGCTTVIVDVGLVPLLGDLPPDDLGDPAAKWTAAATGPLLARRKSGLDAALDRVCRAVHELVRRYPDHRFCLTGNRSLRAVLDPQTLEAVFEDLGGMQLGYWHDVAVIGRRQQVLGEAEGLWLERFGKRMVGMTLGDASSDGVYLPPGLGGVDWGLLASYVQLSPKPLPAVLELDPAVPPAELAGVRSYLDRFGL